MPAFSAPGQGVGRMGGDQHRETGSAASSNASSSAASQASSSSSSSGASATPSQDTITSPKHGGSIKSFPTTPTNREVAGGKIGSAGGGFSVAAAAASSLPPPPPLAAPTLPLGNSASEPASPTMDRPSFRPITPDPRRAPSTRLSALLAATSETDPVTMAAFAAHMALPAHVADLGLAPSPGSTDSGLAAGSGARLSGGRQRSSSDAAAAAAAAAAAMAATLFPATSAAAANRPSFPVGSATITVNRRNSDSPSSLSRAILLTSDMSRSYSGSTSTSDLEDREAQDFAAAVHATAPPYAHSPSSKSTPGTDSPMTQSMGHLSSKSNASSSSPLVACHHHQHHHGRHSNASGAAAAASSDRDASPSSLSHMHLQRDAVDDTGSGAGSESSSLHNSPHAPRHPPLGRPKGSKLRRASDMSMMELVAHVRDDRQGAGGSHNSSSSQLSSAALLTGNMSPTKGPSLSPPSIRKMGTSGTLTPIGTSDRDSSSSNSPLGSSSGGGGGGGQSPGRSSRPSVDASTGLAGLRAGGDGHSSGLNSPSSLNNSSNSGLPRDSAALSSSPSLSSSPRTFPNIPGTHTGGGASSPAMLPRASPSGANPFARTRSVPGLRLATLDNPRVAALSGSTDSLLSASPMDTIHESAENSGMSRNTSLRPLPFAPGSSVAVAAAAAAGASFPSGDAGADARPKAARTRSRASVELAPLSLNDRLRTREKLDYWNFVQSLNLAYMAGVEGDARAQVSRRVGQERKPLSSTCPSCHDIDAAGGFISFGEGDVQGCCIYCRRPLMGDLVDFRAFRMRYAAQSSTPLSVVETAKDDSCISTGSPRDDRPFARMPSRSQPLSPALCDSPERARVSMAAAAISGSPSPAGRDRGGGGNPRYLTPEDATADELHASASEGSGVSPESALEDPGAATLAAALVRADDSRDDLNIDLTAGLPFLAQCTITPEELVKYRGLFEKNDADGDGLLNINQLHVSLTVLHGHGIRDSIKDFAVMFLQTAQALARGKRRSRRRGIRAVNFSSFVIVASLSERLVRADDVALRLRGAFDIHQLVDGIMRAKRLFECSEVDNGMLSVDVLPELATAVGFPADRVDLMIGRLQKQGMHEVNFLDVLAFVPVLEDGSRRTASRTLGLTPDQQHHRPSSGDV